MACRCHECSILTSCRVANCSQCYWLFSLRHHVTTFSLALCGQTKTISSYGTFLKNVLLIFIVCMNWSHLEPIMLHLGSLSEGYLMADHNNEINTQQHASSPRILPTCGFSSYSRSFYSAQMKFWLCYYLTSKKWKKKNPFSENVIVS